MSPDRIATDTHDNEALAVAAERANKVKEYDRLAIEIRMLRDRADGLAPMPCDHVEFAHECACCWYVMIYRWTRDML